MADPALAVKREGLPTRSGTWLWGELERYELDPYALSLYVHLRLWADEHNKVVQSAANLAAWTRMSTRKIRYSLKVLEQHDLISREYPVGECSVITVAEVGR